MNTFRVKLRHPPGVVGLAWALMLMPAPVARAAGASMDATTAPAMRAADLAELSLEQLMEIRIEKVVSASRYEQRVTQAPAAVSIVTGEEIARFGHRTLADVLRSVRGLYASNDGNYSYLGARGFLRPGDYNSRVLMLVDGHRLNDNVYDASNVGRENSLDVDLIERVEVVRGPSSSIYGSSAFFGVINLVTKRGAQLDGGIVSADVGSHGTAQGRVTVGGAAPRGLDWLLSASSFTTRGEREIYYAEFDPRLSVNPAAANRGRVENWDGERAETIFGRVGWGDFLVSGFFSRRGKEVPTSSFGTYFNNRQQRTTDQRVYLDLKYDRVLAPDLQLQGRAFYDQARYAGDYPFDLAAPGDPPLRVLNRDFSFGEWAGAEWQLNARIARHHHLTVGAEWRENLHQDQFGYDVDPWAETLNLRESSRTFGAFAQLEMRVAPAIVFNAGLRHDYYFGSFGGTTNPRLGVIYSATPYTTLKALFGEAFRAPNVYERTYYAAQRHRPNLRPETIRTSELVWEQYLGRNYRFNVSAYHYDVSGLINQSTVGQGDLYFENLEGAHALGFEAEVEGRWDAGTMARVSYGQQRATQRLSGMDLTSSPRRLAKLNLMLPLVRERLFLGYEAQHQARVYTLTRRFAGDFTLSNLTLTLQLPRGWAASVSAYNLFDTRYEYPGAEDHTQDLLPQEGRTLRVKVSRRF